MAISNEKKKEILLKNFDIIKDDCQDNAESLGSAIQKMFKIDKQTAIDMWEYLVGAHEDFIRAEYSFYITAGLVKDLYQDYGKAQIAPAIIKNHILKNALFSQSYEVYGQVDLATYYISTKRLQVVDELLNLLYENSYKEYSWYEVMDRMMCEITYDDIDVSEEAYELLETWCDKVKNDKERAKLNIKLMEFVD